MPSSRLLACASFLLLGACNFQAPEPKRTPPPPTPPIPVSTLTATFTVKTSDIAAALNAKTKDQIAQMKNAPMDCAIAKCHLDLIATRSGPIAVGAANGRLAIALPFKLTADIKFKSRLFKTSAHTDATGQLNAVADLKMGGDWRLDPNVQGTVDLSRGELQLGPLKMTLTDLWNNNQEHLSQPLFRALDKQLASDLKVKPQAERLWHKAFEPIRIGKDPQAWLVLAPESLRVGTLQVSGDSVTLSLGVDGRARVLVGDKPATPDKTPPLPAPQPLSQASNAFQFSVPMMLPYSEAEKLAMQRLQSHPIVVKGIKVSFGSLHILPSGQDVILAAEFCVSQGWDVFGWFNSCGSGYLRGKPVYDAKTQTIRISNVHYDIATAGLVLNAMKALAGGELGNELQDKLVFKVGPDLAKLETEIRTALAKPQTRGVSITGQIQSFGNPTLTWTRDGFLAFFSAQGTVKADLNLKD